MTEVQAFDLSTVLGMIDEVESELDGVKALLRKSLVRNDLDSRAEEVQALLGNARLELHIAVQEFADVLGNLWEDDGGEEDPL